MTTKEQLLQQARLLQDAAEVLESSANKLEALQAETERLRAINETRAAGDGCCTYARDKAMGRLATLPAAIGETIWIEVRNDSHGKVSRCAVRGKVIRYTVTAAGLEAVITLGRRGQILRMSGEDLNQICHTPWEALGLPNQKAAYQQYGLWFPRMPDGNEVR